MGNSKVCGTLYDFFRDFKANIGILGNAGFIIGYRDDGWTDLGECKWGAYGSQARVRRELETKVSRYPNQRGATIGRRFFLQKRPRTAARPGTTPG